MLKWLQFFLIFFVWTTMVFGQDMTIQLTSPGPNSRFEVCSDIRFSADVTIQTGEIRRVEFYRNGSRLRAVTKAPYEFVWEAVPDGIYEIYAAVVDGDNNIVTTDPFFIYVGNVQDGNTIINGEFNCALAPWRLDNYVNALSTAMIVPDLWLTDDSSGVLVEIEQQGDEFWAVQLMQPFKIKEGHTYVVTFTAQADEAKEIHVDISKNYDDYAPLHSATFTVLDAQEYGPFEFTAAADDDNLMFKFVLGGNTIPIEIDAVNCIDMDWTTVETAETVVHSFELYQNYPNPFNPRTTISYSLDKAEQITLSIYNIMGQLMTTHSAFEQRGDHTFMWDGTRSGIACPSGVYLYRLDTESSSITKKMQLLR